MWKKIRSTGAHGLVCLAVLCVAVLPCGAVFAAARPGEADPFDGESSIIMDRDSIIVLSKRAASEPLESFAVSPDQGTAELNRNELKPTINGRQVADAGAEQTPGAGMLVDRNGDACLLWSQQKGSEAVMVACPADKLETATGDGQNEIVVFDGGYRIFAILPGRWDRSNGDDTCFVVAMDTAERRIAIRGVSDVRYDKKAQKWVAPRLGKVTTFDIGGDANPYLVELRAATGDFDGDGRQDIAVAYMQHRDGRASYRIKTLRVALPRELDGTMDWYVLHDMAELDTGLSWMENDGSRLASRNHATMFDIATGDADKDGRDEILFSGATFTSGDMPVIIATKLYRLNEKGDALTAMKDLTPAHSDYYDDGRTMLVRCGMGDIDSDGAEEPVVIYTTGHEAFLAAYKYSATGNNTYRWQNVYYGGSVRALDLKVRNFSGEMKSGAMNANAAEVIFGVWTTKEGGERYIHYMPFNNWNADVAFTRDAGNRWVENSGQGRIAPPEWDDVRDNPSRFHLVAGDFRKAGIRLGAPVYIHKEAELSLLVEMQEPPKHVDYIRTSGNKYAVVNLTRVESFYTDFYKSESSATDTSSSQTAESNMGVNVESSAKAGYEAKLGPIGAEASAELSNSVGLSARLKVARLNESYSSTKTEVTAKTTTDDYISFTSRPIDIWRYPIVGRYSTVSPDHQLWHTVTIPSPVKASTFAGMSYKNYQPTWSNGNILSYPRSMSAITDCREANLLASQSNFSVGSNSTTHKISWSQETKKKSTVEGGAKLSVDSSIGYHAKVSAMGASIQNDTKIKMHADTSFMATKTNTSSFSTKNDIGIVQSGKYNDFYNNSNTYNATAFIYRTEGGVIKTAYTVDILPEHLEWWEQRYSSAPDPALNLPYMWTKDKGSWVVDDSDDTNPNARRIRGFFMTKGDRNVDPGIEETGEINLMCRVHNFAIKTRSESDQAAKAVARNVRVKFEYAPIDKNRKIGSRRPIETPSLARIEVWNNTQSKPNWEFAIAKWDISNVPDGYYRLFVTVNPDRALAELPNHGLRTERYKEPYDNNRGWFEVAIFKPKKTTLDLEDSAGLNPDDAMPVYEVGDVDLSFDGESFDFAVNRARETVTVTASVRNSGSIPAMNVPVTLYRGDDAIAIELVPGIFPGDSVPVMFVLPATTAETAGELTLGVGEKSAGIDMNVVPGDDEGDDEESSDKGSGGGGCSSGTTGPVLTAIAAVALIHRGLRRRRS